MDFLSKLFSHPFITSIFDGSMSIFLDKAFSLFNKNHKTNKNAKNRIDFKLPPSYQINDDIRNIKLSIKYDSTDYQSCIYQEYYNKYEKGFSPDDVKLLNDLKSQSSQDNKELLAALLGKIEYLQSQIKYTLGNGHRVFEIPYSLDVDN